MSRLFCALGLHRPVVTQWIISFGITSSKAISCKRPFCTWGKRVKA